MGNWRTVNIVGSIAPEHVEPLRKHITGAYDDLSSDAWENFGPLTIVEGLCGLNDWVGEKVNAAGNLAERDYDVEDVADHLRKLLAVAPSMSLLVHCGDEWESTTCVATVVVRDGEVRVDEPHVQAVEKMSDADVQARMFRLMFR